MESEASVPWARTAKLKSSSVTLTVTKQSMAIGRPPSRPVAVFAPNLTLQFLIVKFENSTRRRAEVWGRVTSGPDLASQLEFGPSSKPWSLADRDKITGPQISVCSITSSMMQ